MARGQRRSERSNARGAPQGGKESLICGEFGGDYACLFECSSTLCPDGMTCDAELCMPESYTP